jgi:hypothetical protein
MHKPSTGWTASSLAKSLNTSVILKTAITWESSSIVTTWQRAASLRIRKTLHASFKTIKIFEIFYYKISTYSFRYKISCLILNRCSRPSKIASWNIIEIKNKQLWRRFSHFQQVRYNHINKKSLPIDKKRYCRLLKWIKANFQRKSNRYSKN